MRALKTTSSNTDLIKIVSNDEFIMSQVRLKRKKKWEGGITDVSDLDVTVDDKNVQHTNEETVLQENARAYVAGWMCSRINHEICRRNLSCKENPNDYVTTHIANKKYCKDSKIVFPNDVSLMLSQFCSDVFKEIDHVICKTRIGVKKELIKMVVLPVNMSICSDCANVFIDKYFNVLINCYIKNKMDNHTAKKQNKRCMKAAKVVHN